MDPWAFYPVPGRPRGHQLLPRSGERRVRASRKFLPRDAVAYRDFIGRFGELNEGVFETFLKPPTPGSIFGTIFKRNLFNVQFAQALELAGLRAAVDDQLRPLDRRNVRERADCAPRCTGWRRSRGRRRRRSPPATWSGWQAMIHKTGAWRARGGSGALTQALAKVLALAWRGGADRCAGVDASRRHRFGQLARGLRFRSAGQSGFPGSHGDSPPAMCRRRSCNCSIRALCPARVAPPGGAPAGGQRVRHGRAACGEASCRATTWPTR